MNARSDRLFRLLLILLLLPALMPGQPRTVTAAEDPQPLAPTYKIYATREGLVGYTTANGHKIRPRDRFVALPCRCALSPYGTDKMRVRITYNGRSVIAPVWDVGPWNIQDDYWQPGRRYSDLPVGMPMAQAAKLHGYNGGRDEFGRKILLPNGIDIADGTFWDDLKMNKDDWVEVSFLWLGRDPGPGNGATEIIPGPVPPGPPEAPPAPAPPAPEVVEPHAEATNVDNDGQGFSGGTGQWAQAACGVGGSHAWTSSTTDPAKSSHLGSWRPSSLAAGAYELKAYIPRCGETEATRSARYKIVHDEGVSEVSVNQAAAVGSWVSLGVFRYRGFSTPLVELSDLTGDERRAVRFDALAWVVRPDTAPPETTIRSITRQDNGFLVEWGGSDDASGIASYDVQVRQLPNGGWNTWRRATAETSGWFGPDEGKQFAFRVRARDQAGREEEWPEQPDLDTTCAQVRPDQVCSP